MLLVSFSVLTFACSKEEGCTDSTATNYNSEAEKDDGSCSFPATDSSGNGGGTTDTTSSGGNNGGTSTVTYPNTYIVVNTDTMWMVSQNQNYDPSKFRYQINFGTKAQLQQNVTETGSNSTVGLVISFAKKPTASQNFDYTSSRSSIDSSQVNFYAAFFIGTGYSIEDKNFLTPDSGAIALTISGSDVTGKLAPILMTDEGSSGQTITVSGNFDYSW